jgi:molecular chaperone HscB
MQSELVAVVQASQPKCLFCQKGLIDFVSRNVCSSCGRPQPMTDDNYFSIFDLNFHFSPDKNDLEKRFLKVSRVLHPDRFSTAGNDDKKNSMNRMGFLNQAYQTLKDPEALREYFFEYFKVKEEKPNQNQMPLEIADAWFELQDDITPEKVNNFEIELSKSKNQLDQSILKIEENVNRAIQEKGMSFDQSLLHSLLKLVHSKNTLESLQKDIHRRAS